MAETTTKQKTTGAKSQDKDIVSRLADAGEEALQRLADLPGGQRAMTAFNDLRTRVDDLAKKVRGIDELEVRVQSLEKQVAAMQKRARRTTTRTTTRKPPSSS
jgi:phage shock protein A